MRLEGSLPPGVVHVPAVAAGVVESAESTAVTAGVRVPAPAMTAPVPPSAVLVEQTKDVVAVEGVHPKPVPLIPLAVKVHDVAAPPVLAIPPLAVYVGAEQPPLPAQPLDTDVSPYGRP
jgi:hypothetical protein